MDPRRRLNRYAAATVAIAALTLGGCAALRDLGRASAGASQASAPPQAAAAASATNAAGLAVPATAPAPPGIRGVMAPIPNPPGRRSGRARAPGVASASASSRTADDQLARPGPPARGTPAASGRTAIAAANAEARETSRADAFVGGVQVFAYSPGRVYEVWTAPLRVTTLTLGAGEAVVSMAAGDTVRWQIGETRSGQGPGQRGHVMIKPLERGLETNLVLATSQRVYLIQLKSGSAEAFNAAVAWDAGAVLSPAAAALLEGAEAAAPETLAGPAGPLDARFRIEPRGRRPDWTPTAVMTDGVRTFLTFPPGAASGEAPVLLVRGAGGEAQLVNYRQQAGLWVVDRVFDAAELRLGGKRPQVVRIRRDPDAGDRP
ncbi:MAG: TrbG/VirB9 family P-type conjugative transfer protein [Phenylobacterium sp.]|uniref:TrbG/VirB9 family P-type conjugative transfer protein n=1 Tax=Phenylobacterium sp. TaxID=1871053 RepID=UPI00391DACAC